MHPWACLTTFIDLNTSTLCITNIVNVMILVAPISNWRNQFLVGNHYLPNNIDVDSHWEQAYPSYWSDMFTPGVHLDNVVKSFLDIKLPTLSTSSFAVNWSDLHYQACIGTRSFECCFTYIGLQIKIYYIIGCYNYIAAIKEHCFVCCQSRNINKKKLVF